MTSLQLVGVCLFIFVSDEHIAACTDVAVDTCKTGAKGKAGNKGGVAVRLRLYDSSICFVCAHLAAGQSHVSERNQGQPAVSQIRSDAAQITWTSARRSTLARAAPLAATITCFGAAISTIGSIWSATCA